MNSNNKLRRTALEFAISQHGYSPTKTDEILDIAEKYYQFLTKEDE